MRPSSMPRALGLAVALALASAAAGARAEGETPAGAVAEDTPREDAPREALPPPEPPRAEALPPRAEALPPPEAMPPEAMPREAPQREASDDAKKPFNVGMFLGYGSSTLNTGLGLRVGYRFAGGLYLGGTYVHHFGESKESGSPGFTSTATITYEMFGGEVGYSGIAGPVELRPYFGVGGTLGTAARTGYLETSRSEGTGVFSSGGLVAVNLGSTAYVGLDLRAIFFTAGGMPQAVFGGVGGARF